jgi:hypothetical protein
MRGMTTSANEFAGPTASHVSVTDATIDVELTDGRSLSVPVSWYSRLEHATKVERDNWVLTGSGLGIHWPDLDEDISVEALISGTPSKESQTSLARWIESRQA